MRYPWLALLALSPAILYGLALIAVGVSTHFYRCRCPKCQQRGLKSIDFIRATVQINGQRAPDCWADYQCEKCGAVVRWHHRQWEPVPESDVRRHV